MAKKACQNKIWLRRIDDKTRMVYHVKIPCGRKKCPYCANEIRKSHYKRIAHVMSHRANWHWFFISTTGKSWWHDTDDKAGISLEQIRAVWAKFRKRLVRKTKDGKLLWVRVYEQHKSGVYHLHAIIGTNSEFWADSGIGEQKTVKMRSKRKQRRISVATKARIRTDKRIRWIRKAWTACGGGYQVNMTQIHNHENSLVMVGYVVKYTVKTTSGTSRVIEFCRAFPKVGEKSPDKKTYQWLLLGTPPTIGEIRQWQAMGYAVLGVFDILTKKT